MKNLKSNFRILLITLSLLLVFSSCKKEKDNQQNLSSALVKQAVTTYVFSGNRAVTDYTYDSQNRLTGYGNSYFLFAYNAGGILLTYNGGNVYVVNNQISLNNGNIATLRYNRKEGSITTEFLSTFYYDGKGRLIRIFAKELNLTDGFAWSRNYTYAWDDNDNLTESKQEFSRKLDGTVESTSVTKYSGFDSKNVNTVSALNFGFNYFGTTSYPGDYTPTTSGDSGGFLPSVFAGKLLPNKITEGTLTTVAREYEVTYQKNDKNLITRIDQKDTKGNGSVIYDFSYQ